MPGKNVGQSANGKMNAASAMSRVLCLSERCGESRSTSCARCSPRGLRAARHVGRSAVTAAQLGNRAARSRPFRCVDTMKMSLGEVSRACLCAGVLLMEGSLPSSPLGFDARLCALLRFSHEPSRALGSFARNVASSVTDAASARSSSASEKMDSMLSSSGCCCKSASTEQRAGARRSRELFGHSLRRFVKICVSPCFWAVRLHLLKHYTGQSS